MDKFSKGHGKIMNIRDRIPADLGIEEIYGDRILVLQDNEDKKSSGGIIIPVDVVKKELPIAGTVVAIGDEITGDYQIKVKPGDRVVVGKYAGSEYLHSDMKTYIICRMSDVSMKLASKK